MNREKLLSISGDLFWRKGFLATSTDDIAKASKMNKASIYYYFKNKASILFELSTAAMKTLLDQALPILNSNLGSEEKLRTFIINHVDFELTHLGLSGIGQIEKRNLPPKFLKAYIDMRDEYEGIFRRILKEGVEDNNLQCENIELTSLFILGLLNSIVQWFKITGKVSHAEIASEAHAFIYKALRSDNLKFSSKRQAK